VGSEMCIRDRAGAVALLEEVWYVELSGRADFIDRFVAAYHDNSPFVHEGRIFLAAEQTYGVNAQYLLAHAIQESGWGLYPIAPHNHFGYAAYDRCPSSCAKSFSSDEEGIMFAAAFVHEQYLTPGGTWYVSPTLEGMNRHYASDQGWAGKVAEVADMMDRFQ